MHKTFRSICIILLLISCSATLYSQDYSGIEALSDSLFTIGLNERLIPGGIISMVYDGNVLLSRGYGYADYENKIPANENTLFQIGSVGKIFTTAGVLKLVESGKLDLQEDIRKYIGNNSNILPDDRKVTLAHLLTHTAGINEQVIGYAARTADAVQLLEQFLEENFPGYFQEPGLSISYSNYGYAVAGLIIEKIAGSSFTDFIQDELFDPLEMGLSTYVHPDDNIDTGKYAFGYLPSTAGFDKQITFHTHTKPAGGMNSTASEMADFMLMMLNEGMFKSTRILSPESILRLTERQFSNHRELTGYTYGFEEQIMRGHQAVAKGGGTLGFTSLMYLLPDLNTGLFISTNVRNDDFIEMYLDAFTERFIPEITNEAVVESRSEPINQVAGVYRNNRYNHDTIEDLLSLFRDNITINVSEGGNLTVFSAGKNREFRLKEYPVFINIKNPAEKIAFAENEEGDITHAYLHTQYAGSSVPATYEKVGILSNPGFVNEFFLSFIPAYLAAYLLYPLLFIVILLMRKLRETRKPENSIHFHVHVSGFIFALLSTTYSFGYIAALNHTGTGLAFGIPDHLLKYQYIPLVLIIVGIMLMCKTVSIWTNKSGNPFSRLFITGYMLSAAIYVLFLFQWNFVTMPF